MSDASRGSDGRLEELINDLLDDRLSDADERLLAERLAGDPEARRMFRHWLDIHAALHWDYAAAAADEGSPAVAGRITADRSAWAAVIRGTIAGMVIVAAALAMVGMWRSPTGQPIVRVAALSGAAAWSDDGSVESHLGIEDRLAGGTIRVEGDSSLLELVFDDGTRVLLVGESLLEFHDEGQKRLLLHRGEISVAASRQPDGRPMLIRTPTAEVQVIGTVFSLVADASRTHLGVEEGSVIMRRLVDGSSVQVSGRRTATASLSRQEPLEAAAPGVLPPAYRQTFVQRPGGRCQGMWLAADGNLPARMQAVAYRAGSTAAGAPIVHFGTTLAAEDPGFVTIEPATVVAVRFRTAVPETLRVMLGVRRPGGAFGGNFETKFHTDEMPADADGWRWARIPLAAFVPITDHFQTVPAGTIASILLVDTFQSAARLEVCEVRVEQVEPDET